MPPQKGELPSDKLHKNKKKKKTGIKKDKYVDSSKPDPKREGEGAYATFPKDPSIVPDDSPDDDEEEDESLWEEEEIAADAKAAEAAKAAKKRGELHPISPARSPSPLLPHKHQKRHTTQSHNAQHTKASKRSSLISTSVINCLQRIREITRIACLLLSLPPQPRRSVWLSTLPKTTSRCGTMTTKRSCEAWTGGPRPRRPRARARKLFLLQHTNKNTNTKQRANVVVVLLLCNRHGSSAGVQAYNNKKTFLK